MTTRFFVLAGASMVAAYAVARLLVGSGATGPALETLVVGGLLLALWPAARLAARRMDKGLGVAREAVDRIASGERDPLAGSPDSRSGRLASAASDMPLGRAIGRMVDRIRDRVALSERESGDLRALFENLEDGLAIVDEAGVVAFCNPAFEGWAGRTVAPGTRIGTLFRTPRIAEAVGDAGQGAFVADEIKLGERTVLLSARPHRVGALVTLRDRTAMRRLQGVRRDFVANVSHELKTPLTSVVGFAEALAGGSLPSTSVRDFAGRILANATRMRVLVEDLLDLSRLESGSWRPRPEPVMPALVAQEVWESLDPRVRQAELKLAVVGDDEPVHADPGAIRQILRNLLDNAVRYNDEESLIAVRVRPEGLFQRIEVTDQGPGIPSVHVERVFERFYRIDPARSRERGGTGLGLAIVKHLVEAHGGKVGIQSAVGQGTTVWVTLPLSTQFAEKEEAAGATA